MIHHDTPSIYISFTHSVLQMNRVVLYQGGGLLNYEVSKQGVCEPIFPIVSYGSPRFLIRRNPRAFGLLLVPVLKGNGPQKFDFFIDYGIFYRFSKGRNMHNQHVPGVNPLEKTHGNPRNLWCLPKARGETHIPYY